jgi:hypothetical protein
MSKKRCGSVDGSITLDECRISVVEHFRRKYEVEVALRHLATCCLFGSNFGHEPRARSLPLVPIYARCYRTYVHMTSFR